MSRPRWPVPVLLALAVPFAVAACDGDDRSDDEDQVTEAIEQSATGTDPTVCTTYQTQNFTEETSGETGSEAIGQCEKEQQEEPIATSVEVSEIEVDDGGATVVVAFEDGFIAGQSLEIGLAEEDGQWKLDELIGFVDFDRARYIDGFVQGVSEEAEGGQALQDCVRQGLQSVSDEDLQAAFLDNDQKVFDEAVGPCFG